MSGRFTTNHATIPKKRPHPYWGNGIVSTPHEDVAMNDSSPWKAGAFHPSYTRSSEPIYEYEHTHASHAFNRTLPSVHMPIVPSEPKPKGRTQTPRNYGSESPYLPPGYRHISHHAVESGTRSVHPHHQPTKDGSRFKEVHHNYQNNDAETIADEDNDGQEKARGLYKCGRCGAPKKGHQCPYKPKLFKGTTSTPPETRTIAVQVEMNDNLLLRRLNIEIQGFPESYTSNVMEDNVGREIRLDN